MGKIVLITGANGVMARALIPELAKNKKCEIVGLDINELDSSLKPLIKKFYKGNVVDKRLLGSIINAESVDTIFHLAAILPPFSEVEPEKAHIVNVSGTSTLLELLNKKAEKENRAIKFIFPSSIAVYGIANLETKTTTGKVYENQFLNPITMYGINKLYCEMLGTYYDRNYKMLETKKGVGRIDFRCARFPGIISALDEPTNKEEEYALKTIHSVAKGEGYESFVRPDTTLPFIAMPDVVKALMMLAEADKKKLRQPVYNVTGFSAKAEEIAQFTNKVFPDSATSYNPDEARQKIVDSWPSAIDDSAARDDWGWQADYDIEKTFSEYLAPEMKG
ncbi:NAD-dependent epimerase/dehydratase family protein [Patescibacteria group bacterium]|nr:NAD-dependent epimerase/dehydratase family protein [Patescibacteria group bacterium]